MRRIHQDNKVREELLLCDLDEIARQGARRMLIEALEAEVEEYVEAASSERDQRGHALVARNGRAREREVVVGAGAVKVRAPRVNDRRMDEGGGRRRFSTPILPPYMRRSPKVSRALPHRTCMGSPAGTSLRLWRDSSEASRDSRRRA